MLAAQQLEAYPPIMTQQLLLSVIEQLKLPLLHIARQAELGKQTADTGDLAAIQATADVALRLLDNYLLGVQLAGRRTVTFDVEPVSIPSALYEAGTQLGPLAENYGVRLDIRIEGKYGPVMAHRQGLQAAFVSLGSSLIEALPAMTEPSRLTLQLSAHRCRYGVVAGLYCEAPQLTAQALRQGRLLHGTARQPLGPWSHTSGAGVFVADALLHAMRARLTATRWRRLYGLGTVLSLNPQLQLV